MEFRVRLKRGGTRWVLVRGFCEPKQEGWAIPGGHGIVIDITEGRNGAVPALLAPDFVAPDEEQLEPIHRAVDHATAAHHEIAQIPRALDLVMTSHALLVALGQRLSRDMMAAASAGDPR